MSGNREATVKFKAETSQFDDALKKSSSKMSQLTSELKLTSAEMRAGGSSTELLENKQRVLSQMVEQAKAKQDAYTSKLQAAKAVYGENSTEVEKLTTQLNRAKTQEANLQNQLSQTNSAVEMQDSAFGVLTAELSKQESQLSALKTKYKSIVLEQGENSQSAKELASKITSLNTDINENKAKLDAAESAARQFDGALDDVRGSAENAGDGFTVFKGILSNLATDVIYRAIDGVKELSGEIVGLGINFTAAMSEVEALSGASAEEMEQLEATARDMGATTIYSATDAATALKYMALAGWDTQQMCGGIPGILNLAASSGMDLGKACDIVTDYLSAFNMEASQAGTLADMMAWAQANANLTTENLAESWKNCAAYLNAGGQSANVVTSELSMMANQGYKGSEAGTALSAIMRDMTNSMKDGAIKIGDVSVAVADADGNYRSLLDIVKDVESVTGDMSETQRATALATTFTADSTKGLNLLLNAGADEAIRFSKSLEASEGAASKMSDTMNDNLQGDFAEMSSALEEVGLQIWEELEEPIRDAAQEFTREVPKMGNAVKGVLPGAIRTATKTISNMADNVDDLVVAGGALIVTLNGAKIATTGLKVVQTASTWMNAYRAATAAGATATSAATTATRGLNIAMAANPVGLVVTGLSALVTVLMLVESTEDAAAGSTEALNEKYSDTTDAVADAVDAHREYHDALDETTAANLAQIANAEQLAGELSSLVDENGRVEEANRARASFILGELNSALGTEISMNDGVIEGYQGIRDEVYKTIEAKKAEIVMQSQEEAYRNAVEQKTAAEETYYQTVRDLTAANNDLKAAENEMSDFYTQNGVSNLQELAEKALATGSAMDEQAVIEAQRLEGVVEANRQSVSDRKETLDQAKNDYVGYVADMSLYEQMAVAMEEGNSQEVMRLYNEQSDAVAKALADQNLSYDEKLSALQTDLENEQALLDLYQEQMKAGNSAFTQSMVDDQKAKVSDAQSNLDEFSRSAPANFASNLNDGAPSVGAASGNVFSSLRDPLSGAPLLGTSLGGQAGSNFASGVGSHADNAQRKSESVVRRAERGLASGDGGSLGSDLGYGYAGGILSNGVLSAVASNAASLVSTALSAIQSRQNSNSPAKESMYLGEDAGEGYGIGYVNRYGFVAKRSAGMVETALGELDHAASLSGELDGFRIAPGKAASMPLYRQELRIDGAGDALASAIEDLANRPIIIEIDGKAFAVATAGASDRVSGSRQMLVERGLSI